MRDVLLLLPLLFALPATADDLVREFAVQEGGSLRITLERGNVDVVTHDGDRVRLEARARGVGASGVHFVVEERDGSLELKAVLEPSCPAACAWRSRPRAAW